jgi:hypothetical protein
MAHTAALHVDAPVAVEIAFEYQDAPSARSPLVDAAYAQLAIETDKLFAVITWPGRPGAVRHPRTRPPRCRLGPPR